MGQQNLPVEHSHTEVAGFDVTASTHTDPAYWTGKFVWVGYGAEGRHLTPGQALELAAALTAAAAAFPAETTTAGAAL